MKTYDLSREDVLNEVYDRCMKELYEKAQPSADINDYIAKIKSGELSKSEQKTNPIYNRHYLSHEEAQYIIDKYVDAYRLENQFKSDCDLLLSDMSKKYTVDKYIDEHTDEYGNWHPGYRGYEDMPSIKDQVKSKLVDLFGEAFVDNSSAEQVTKIFSDFIENRKNFYRFDRDLDKFNTSIWLGAVPTSNKEKVIEYWKTQGEDIEIKDHDPETFWYRDHGYTEEEIEEELRLDEEE